MRNGSRVAWGWNTAILPGLTANLPSRLLPHEPGEGPGMNRAFTPGAWEQRDGVPAFILFGWGGDTSWAGRYDSSFHRSSPM